MKPVTITIAISLLTLTLVISLLGSIGTGLKQAPNITVIDLKGNSISLKSLQGSPLLVTFWASNCGTCMKEFPELVSLYNEFSDKGLNMIGIAMPYDMPRAVTEVSQYYSVPYPLVLDSSSEATSAFGGVQNTPTSFLIGPNGKIELHTVGAVEISYIRENILKLLPGSPQKI
jgi:peroxiredoxin